MSDPCHLRCSLPGVSITRGMWYWPLDWGEGCFQHLEWSLGSAKWRRWPLAASREGPSSPCSQHFVATITGLHAQTEGQLCSSWGLHGSHLFLIYLGVDRAIWKIFYYFQCEQGPDSVTCYGYRLTHLCWLCKTFVVGQLLFLSLFFACLLPVVMKVHWNPLEWVKGLTCSMAPRSPRTGLCLGTELSMVCGPEWVSSLQQGIYLSSTVCISGLFETKLHNSIKWLGSMAYKFLK